MAAAKHPAGASAPERREALKAVWHEARGCRRCALAETRTTVVFGAGHADADLMFVGEAPGRHEDEQGLPFVGQAGKLLDSLLAEIGMERGDVFIANVLKCRPPGNRDPLPGEIDACSGYLHAQIALIQPRVICTLGNFATKLLRQDRAGITRIHGTPEIRVVGGRAVRLYPLFHPAAALYNRDTLVPVLRDDFARIPDLLALPAPPQPAAPTAPVQPPGPAGADGGAGALPNGAEAGRADSAPGATGGPASAPAGRANGSEQPPGSADEPAPVQLGLF